MIEFLIKGQGGYLVFSLITLIFFILTFRQYLRDNKFNGTCESEIKSSKYWTTASLIASCIWAICFVGILILWFTLD